MEEKKYPYLGSNFINGKQYVVLFSEEDMGTVVMNDTDDESIVFGKFMSFDESLFKPLPKDVIVRLQN